MHSMVLFKKSNFYERLNMWFLSMTAADGIMPPNASTSSTRMKIRMYPTTMVNTFYIAPLLTAKEDRYSNMTHDTLKTLEYVA